MSNPKREELVELLFAKFGYSDVDVKHGDWRALRLVECADAILEWHTKQINERFPTIINDCVDAKFEARIEPLMMRDIRFRVWDIERKKMYYKHFGLSNTGSPLYYIDCFKEDSGWTHASSLRTIDVLMQFTGLKDKNGKEIYEGDIVIKDCYIWFDEGKPNYRGTVEWIYSQWQVVAHCINPNKSGISDGMNEGFNDKGIDEGGNSDWKVIGNIYENPELLFKVREEKR